MKIYDVIHFHFQKLNSKYPRLLHILMASFSFISRSTIVTKSYRAYYVISYN